mmetsp:Transcript_3087/g.10255  ORF Transcript_3087/g.10255 Transcript_3087/m.10255 type:complete len:616 (-) Transcript_3087:31-1878(-)
MVDPRRVAIVTSVVAGLLSILWPMLESAFGAVSSGSCPLGYTSSSPLGKTDFDAASLHGLLKTPSSVGSTTVAYVGCRFMNTTGTSNMIVSSTGRVLAINSGSERALKVKFAGASIRRCRGKFIVPGFVDAHVHLITGGFALGALDLSNVRSKLEFVDALATNVGENGWILGYGWDETRFADVSSTPSIDWLRADGRFDGVKVWVIRADAHAGFASVAALEASGITKTTVVAGGVVEVDENGELTGMVKELAMARVQAVIPPHTAHDRQKAIRAGVSHLLSKGITSIGDFGDIDSLVAGPSGFAQLWKDFEVLAAWDANKTLPIRITTYMPIADWKSVASHEAWNDGFVRENATTSVISRVRLGGVKAFLDGSLGSRTAAMMDSYDDNAATSGKLMYAPGKDEQAFMNLARDADAAGLEVSVHAIGDRAVEQALDTLQAIKQANGDRITRRFRIEHAQHLQSPIDEQPRKFSELGATASVQPTQISLDKWSVIQKLGVDRASRAYAFKTFINNDVPLAGGSDWPIVGADVFDGIFAATHRDSWTPSEALSPTEAVHAYTKGSARALRMEGMIGEITIGALADFVVLDSSPLDTNKKPEVIATYVDGTCVHGRCLA